MPVRRRTYRTKPKRKPFRKYRAVAKRTYRRRGRR